MNFLRYFSLLSLLLLVQACSIGPIKITSKEGELPKVQVDTGYDACDLRIKKREVNYECKWEVEM